MGLMDRTHGIGMIVILLSLSLLLNKITCLSLVYFLVEQARICLRAS